MVSDLPLLVVGAIVAGFVQGLSGFGFSMVAMSLWAWGLEPRVAAVMAVFGSVIGQIVIAFSVRRPISLRVLAPFLAGGIVGIPIGVTILPYLNPHLFRLVLGLMLVIWCPIMLFSHHLPRVTAGGRLTDALIGAAGGVMGGIGGFTGVVPTLWTTLRGLEKDHQRAIIQNFNLATLSFTMAAYVATGAVTADMIPAMPVVAVALLVPSVLGAKAYVGLSQAAFRRVVLSLLTLSGVAMLTASVPNMFV